MSIGQNIQRLRKEAGISQEKLGELIGKTRSAVSYYEKGTIIPRMGVIEDLAAVFGVSKTEIIETPEYTYTKMSIRDAQEQELLDMYRKLPPKAKSALIAGLREYGTWE